jgi:hypothetical protein
VRGLAFRVELKGGQPEGSGIAEGGAVGQHRRADRQVHRADGLGRLLVPVAARRDGVEDDDGLRQDSRQEI